MKVLLDESVPRGLKNFLPEHDVRTVVEEGWKSRRNGDLLRLAEGRFDVLITADQGMEYEQNLERFDVAIVILIARKNRLQDYQPLAAELAEAVAEIRSGQSRKLTAP